MKIFLDERRKVVSLVPCRRSRFIGMEARI